VFRLAFAGVVLALSLMLLRTPLEVIGTALVVNGMKGVGALHLMLEFVAPQGGVPVEILHAADLPLARNALLPLDMSVDDHPRKWVYLRHDLPAVRQRRAAGAFLTRICIGKSPIDYLMRGRSYHADRSTAQTTLKAARILPLKR